MHQNRDRGFEEEFKVNIIYAFNNSLRAFKINSYHEIDVYSHAPHAPCVSKEEHPGEHISTSCLFAVITDSFKQF